jgi:flagellar protein FliO/FliZ
MIASLLDEVSRLLGALLLVMGGLFVAVRLAGRYRSGSKSSLRVIARVPLTKGSSLVMVTVGKRILLLGTGEHGVSMLSEVSAEDVEDAAPQETAAGTAGESPPPSIPAPWGAMRSSSAPGGASGGPGTGLIRRLQLMTLRSQRPGPTRGRRR